MQFNDILRLEFIGALPRVTSSNSILKTNTMHLMKAIEYKRSSTKGGEISELKNPDGMRNNISGEEHTKTMQQYFPSG